MKRILFVCLGNICRSPSAEAVFQHQIEIRNLEAQVSCDSAGIIAVHAGEPADGRMRAHGSQRGYTLNSISRPVVASDFEDFDLIIGMDNQNIADLHKKAPNTEAKQKIHLMLDFAPEQPVREVPDPYYGGAQGFETVLDLLEASCGKLLDSLQ